MISFIKSTILFVVIVLGISAVFLFNERNRAAFGSEGYIEKGTKFGLKIGGSKKETTEQLVELGLNDVSKSGTNEVGYNPQSCHRHIYDDEYEVQSWLDRSWRGGTICVAYLNGNLTRMSWSYNMMAP